MSSLTNAVHANSFVTNPLSQREREVLKLITEGATNTEIARTLYVSPNTIKTHVRNILNKLGVEHRLQAAVVALRHNLI